MIRPVKDKGGTRWLAADPGGCIQITTTTPDTRNRLVDGVFRLSPVETLRITQDGQASVEGPLSLTPMGLPLREVSRIAFPPDSESRFISDEKGARLQIGQRECLAFRTNVDRADLGDGTFDPGRPAAAAVLFEADLVPDETLPGVVMGPEEAAIERRKTDRQIVDTYLHGVAEAEARESEADETLQQAAGAVPTEDEVSALAAALKPEGAE